MLFLVLLIIIAATCVAAKVMLRDADRTLSLPMPPIPANPDPYETAYLATGTSLVVQSMIVSLTQRGYLTRSLKKVWFGRVECIQASGHLLEKPSLPERELAHWFSEPRTGYDAFWTGKLPGLIQPQFFNCDENLRRIGLLTPPYVKHAGNVLWLGGTLIIADTVLLAWGLLKFRADKIPLFMLVFMVIIAAGLLGVICTNPPHPSALGSAYLKQLRSRYESYKSSALPGNSPTLPLLVALFGLRVLEKTEMEWLSELKDKSEPSSD